MQKENALRMRDVISCKALQTKRKTKSSFQHFPPFLYPLLSDWLLPSITSFFPVTTRLLSWPDKERCFGQLQYLVISLSLFIFLVHLTLLLDWSRTVLLKVFDVLKNLRFIITLVLLFISSSSQPVQPAIKFLFLRNPSN